MGLCSASAKRRLVHSVLALVAVASASSASAVSMTLGTANIPTHPGSVAVPVTVGNTAGILGIAVSFSYNQNIATATQVQAAAAAANCTVIPSISTPGMVVITAACPSGLPAGTNTVLFNVTFSSVANGTTPLTFTETPEVPDGCFLNEGSPSCEPVAGQLSVGPVVPTGTATATATNTVPVATATATNTTIPASATATATNTTIPATATNTAIPATATATGTVTFTNTIGPSPTPSETRTSTQTATVTNTPTVTTTPISTNTFTATFTQTPTPTQTETRTVTPTRTITNTPNATTTRPPIPVVPSPASPAGVLMIVALCGGLVWALRRVSKNR